MRHIPAELRRLVLRRSAGLCEYCHLSQAGQEATFHIDHVTSIAVDPTTGNEVLLFNPRQDDWSEHFAWQGTRLIGLTPVGRATINALDMNRALILAIREEEAILGRWLN